MDHMGSQAAIGVILRGRPKLDLSEGHDRVGTSVIA